MENLLTFASGNLQSSTQATKGSSHVDGLLKIAVWPCKLQPCALTAPPPPPPLHDNHSQFRTIAAGCLHSYSNINNALIDSFHAVDLEEDKS